MRTLSRLFQTTLFFSLFFALHAGAQNNRIVKDRKVFICTMSDRDTFQTAAEGCKHWAKEHLQGYTFQEGSDVTQTNGAVKCTCTKSGQGTNEQQGMIMGIIICPENASELNEPAANFESRKCQCYSIYVEYNGKCVRPEDVPKEEPKEEPKKDSMDACSKAQGLTNEQAELKKQVVQRMQEVVNKANEDFAKDPTIVKNLFTKSELDRYGKAAYQKWIWNQGYGHAIERLTAQAVQNDRLLSSTVEYIPNIQQTQSLPDFKGKGKLPSSVSFDITTQGQVGRKMGKGKDCWEFITYKRLVNADGSPAN